MENSKVKIELVAGVEGHSLYLNDTRICGSKPWGGGSVIKKWTTSIDNIQNALGFKFTEDQLNLFYKQNKSE